MRRKKKVFSNEFILQTYTVKNSDLLLLLDSHFAKTATIAQPRHLTWLLIGGC